MALVKVASFLIILISSITVLKFGESIFVPIILALLLWLIVRKCKSMLDKIRFVKRFVPSAMKTILVSSFFIALIWIVSTMLLENVVRLTHSFNNHGNNMDKIVGDLNNLLHVNLYDFAKEKSLNVDFSQALSLMFDAIKNLVGNFFLILIYALFIFLEEATFIHKLKAIFVGPENFDKVMVMFEKINTAVMDYISLKTLVSFITGLLSYIVLLVIGVEAPVFWASLIFILNFIPTIGSFIAILFPALFSLIQFGEYAPFVLIILFIGLIQVLVGNILEPKIMGDSLNISGLVAIIALALWGSIWGLIGMILSIPITSILIIICSQFKSTRYVAILLSSKGNV